MDVNSSMPYRYSRLIVIVIPLYLSGCGVMYLNAPPNSDIRLLSKTEKAEVKVERHAWFKFWGAQPMNPDDVNASKIIEEHGLKEARIQMTNTFMDGIYSIVPGIFGFPRRTLIVEGNPTLHMSKEISPSADNSQDRSPTGTQRQGAQ